MDKEAHYEVISHPTIRWCTLEISDPKQKDVESLETFHRRNKTRKLTCFDAMDVRHVPGAQDTGGKPFPSSLGWAVKFFPLSLP